MELRHLQYFVAAADSLNFSRAAESLYITQPTLSQQIAELERELGVRLFARDKRSVTLTAAGEALLNNAKDILHRTEAVSRLVRDAQSDPPVHGQFCIGYEPSILDNAFGFSAISNASMRIRREHPAVRLYYRPLDIGDLDKPSGMEDSDAAVIMRMETPERGHWKCRKLFEDRLVLVCCDDSDVDDSSESVRRIIETHCLFMRPQEVKGMFQIIHILDDFGVRPKIRFEESLDTAKLLVASGDGCIVVPESFLGKFDYERAHVLHFGVPGENLTAYLIWNEKNENPILPLYLDSLSKELE